MNGTIICLLEERQSADAAVGVAARLSERFGARLLLVAVEEGAPRPSRREAFAAELAFEHGLPLEVEKRVAVDVATIAAIAYEEAAELIVVGSRPGRFGRTMRSDLGRELAATAPCPVVVVPPENEVARAPLRAVATS